MKTFLAALPFSVGLLACQEHKTPTPPSMSEVVTRYDQLTGELTPETALALSQAIVVEIQTLERLTPLMEAVLENLGYLGGQSQTKRSLTTRTQALSSEGYAQIDWICPGLNPSVIDKDNGKLTLTAVMESAGEFADVIWGEVEACILAKDDQPTIFDGDVQLYAPDLSEGRLLLDFNGTYSLGDAAPSPLNIDLLLDGGVVYFDQQLDEASFLVGFDTAADGLENAIRVKDRHGIWGCVLDDDLHGRCTLADEEVSW